MKKTNWKPWHFVTRKLSNSDWLTPAPKDEIKARQIKILIPLFFSIFISSAILFSSTPWITAVGFITVLCSLFLTRVIDSYRFLTTAEIQLLTEIESRYKNVDPKHHAYRVVMLLKPIAIQQGFLMCGQLRAAKAVARKQIDDEVNQSWGRK